MAFNLYINWPQGQLDREALVVPKSLSNKLVDDCWSQHSRPIFLASRSSIGSSGGTKCRIPCRCQILPQDRRILTIVKSLQVQFLDASSHLYMRLCPSVRRSVGWSVTLFFLNAEKEPFSL